MMGCDRILVHVGNNVRRISIFFQSSFFAREGLNKDSVYL